MMICYFLKKIDIYYIIQNTNKIKFDYIIEKYMI